MHTQTNNKISKYSLETSVKNKCTINVENDTFTNVQLVTFNFVLRSQNCTNTMRRDVHKTRKKSATVGHAEV